MTQKSSRQMSGLFHDDEEDFYGQLDHCAEPLRNSARNMVSFIDCLENKTQALESLKKSYFQIESMPAKNLCHGIEDVKSSLLKVEFLSSSSTLAVKEQEDFISFFELQNSFNAEVNSFVKKVIQLEMIG
jgi:hypothetical protein